MSATFDLHCRQCPRLADFLDEVGTQYPDYHARPVDAFGDANPQLLVVGLAPGMHGANATGRPFTGDHAGILLYATLHRHGFATESRGLGQERPAGVAAAVEATAAPVARQAHQSPIP